MNSERTENQYRQVDHKLKTRFKKRRGRKQAIPKHLQAIRKLLTANDTRC